MERKEQEKKQKNEKENAREASDKETIHLPALS